MKLLCMFAALLVCVCAQEWYEGDEQAFVDNSEYQYRLDQLRKQRDRRPKREVTGSIPVGDNGKLIGTLGDTAKGGLYGTGAYEHSLINNNGGRLAAQAYGTRVLNPNKDSTYYGGKLDWSDSNMHASADARQRIGGRARVDLEAGGRWEPFKNSDLTAGGYYSHREGRPSDYGGRAIFNYRF
ncbi:gloverin-like [Cydia splendana]|uniref:gloverin-like n=1 Tax=Cydia splendana TaxID=1100963 RepID=UPI0021259F6B